MDESEHEKATGYLVDLRIGRVCSGGCVGQRGGGGAVGQEDQSVHHVGPIRYGERLHNSHRLRGMYDEETVDMPLVRTIGRNSGFRADERRDVSKRA